MPTTPVAVGSGRMSGPPTGFATQSGSLTTPHTLKRIARGVLITFGKPIATRVFGGIPMPNPTGADLEYQKHVDEPEGGGDPDEEVAGQCLAGVIPDVWIQVRSVKHSDIGIDDVPSDLIEKMLAVPCVQNPVVACE